ncbi:IclR family pca regulon transcriptional regulator [Streptomyces sp. SAI-135]|jgi:IclR family pca regulon transcriptional regulator|uniref:IclR family transcriptional regulator domain-containing protein n=1 Tax=unclassified Streptomyces TaxID=2593676 RepID=UPI00247712DD|nr:MULTISPECIES: IclR family transcriptional regulator C-terminal domain-containing protein [unclassified Streptomyces]MDH6522608.1 IclR family pca regulon transcriptional regulator [Streptomyces sp. SAI-090]MDH6554231.1 IclR family pca regulon transcriptional regulator [Streptomyces sp. SAI-041]MDH6573491.1 IclR family pca regulon transcriptional regulator [Streptomyces sp. SAI-117]MDH6581771.1 IclR family pca regulon transcriptional regulator [Streptomyces sp. SAI-133]MDH6613774.1 IclR famil
MSEERETASPHVITSVVKSLTLLQVFSDDIPRVTVSRAAELTGMTRPSARRILLTFVDQGFMYTDGREYWLSPKVMRLGFGYLSTLPFWETAQPHLRELATTLQESCSLATLDGDEVVYVIRVPVREGLLALNVGSRLPAHATSLGKALLATSRPETVERFLASGPFPALTENTITEASEMDAEFTRIRRRGYATANGERELGVRSAAAPVLGADGYSVAAINVTANSVRVSQQTLVEKYAPAVVRTAGAISATLGYRADPTP